MNKKIWKEIIIYVCIAVFFVILSYAFMPGLLSGKIVNQSDISGWQGMAQETLAWNAQYPDDKALWTDSMFGGMPTVTMLDDFSGDLTKPLYKALLWGKRPASYLLLALLGAFLMMLAMGVNRYVAIIGAIAVAFCSYNFQIIQVGHNTKMQAIALAPWAIAAFIFTYRKAFEKQKYWPWIGLGSVLFALALSMQIKANHVQITYYLAIILLVYALATLVWVLLKEHRHLFKRFAAASAALLVLGIVGIGTNANKLMPTAAYAPFTMRGGSELTSSDRNANADGLSLDYATAWSYGVEEIPNLMIPNFNGGASGGALGEGSATWELFKKAGQNPRQICSSLPLYWGPQPFTAGPMYIGAISIFLFILGLFLLRGREKWWLLICCVLALLLSLGNHFMWFTKLMFDYAPMYNKFRTLSMALVVLQFCIPLLGIYTLDRIVKEEIPHRKVVKAVWWSFGITAGFCAIAALFPSLAGDFSAASDSGMQDIIAKALREDRRGLLQADAWRSFLFITLAAAVLMFSYLKPDPFVAKGRVNIAAAVIGVLVLADMWSVGKRYLNESDFLTPREFSSQLDERPVDKIIGADKGLSYRVLDLSESTFNSSKTSYRHKSIGGYSPTKMQRYQDLIDRCISPEIKLFYSSVGAAGSIAEIEKSLPYLPVLSMLNAKYIIVGPKYPPVVNAYANGPAWFVQQTVSASTPDEEIALLAQVDPRTTAVIKAADAWDASDAALGARTVVATDVTNRGTTATGTIEMTCYSPNEVRYSYSSPAAGLAVFSEIYHPSWVATLNGEPLKLLQTDWVLRGALLPAGSGEIVMRYVPSEYATGRNISLVCSSLLLLLLVGLLVSLKIKW